MLKCNFFQGWCQRVLTSVTKVTRAGAGGGGSEMKTVILK